MTRVTYSLGENRRKRLTYTASHYSLGPYTTFRTNESGREGYRLPAPRYELSPYIFYFVNNKSLL